MMISITWAIFGPNVEHALNIMCANEMDWLYSGELSQPLHCFASLSYCVRNIPLLSQQFTKSYIFAIEIGLNENSAIDYLIYIRQFDRVADKPRQYLHKKSWTICSFIIPIFHIGYGYSCNLINNRILHWNAFIPNNKTYFTLFYSETDLRWFYSDIVVALRTNPEWKFSHTGC